MSAPADDPPPPPLAQAGSFLASLAGWAAGGFGVAPPEERARRLALCAACPSFDPGPRRCRECGCLMPVKARLPGARCPLGKWGPLGGGAGAPSPADGPPRTPPPETPPRCGTSSPTS